MSVAKRDDTKDDGWRSAVDFQFVSASPANRGCGCCSVDSDVRSVQELEKKRHVTKNAPLNALTCVVFVDCRCAMLRGAVFSLCVVWYRTHRVS